MVTKAQKKSAERTALLKSIGGHAVSVLVAFIGFWQDNPALGWTGAIFAVGLPVLRNYLDAADARFGVGKK